MYKAIYFTNTSSYRVILISKSTFLENRKRKSYIIIIICTYSYFLKLRFIPRTHTIDCLEAQNSYNTYAYSLTVHFTIIISLI